jgi:hypothetical protein
MEERLRKLEVALQHMELHLLLHQRSLKNNPKEYSDSFKHGQQLIFDDVMPSLQEAKLEFNLLKEELLCQKN